VGTACGLTARHAFAHPTPDAVELIRPTISAQLHAFSIACSMCQSTVVWAEPQVRPFFHFKDKHLAAVAREILKKLEC
jgi:hypothetical protein